MQAKRRASAGVLLTGLIAAAAAAAPGDARAQTMPQLRIGQSVNGTLAAGDPTANQRGRFKVYQIDGRAGQRLSIRMNSSEFDTYLSVGRTVAGITDVMKFDDDGGGEESGSGTNSRVRFTVPAAGRYLVIAQAFGEDATGGFTLSVDTLPRAIPTPPRAIQVGQSLSGDLAETDLSMDPEDVYYDLYTFQGKAGQRVQVSMDAETFDAYLDVGRMASGELEVLESNDDAPGQGSSAEGEAGTNSRLRFNVPTDGQYVIRARSLGAASTGAYTVRLEQRAAPTPPPAPRPITAGQSVSGALEESDPQSDDESYYDAYVLRGARAGDKLTITMRSEAFDTYVVVGRMVGGEFQEVATGDDGADGTNTLLEVTLEEAGDYVIRANSLSAESTGAYTLVVQSGR